MPLYRRLPKRGFVNIFSKRYVVLNVCDLNQFNEGTEVSVEMLREIGYVKKIHDGLRILGKGELDKKISVRARHFSKSARQKIEASGGFVEVVT